jgi:ATP synthase protein I
MSEKIKIKSIKVENSFGQNVGEKVTRRLKARRNSDTGVWFGLGMMGLIGWSIVVPTFLGAMIGMWVDRHRQDAYSWTLMLLIIGLVIGCLNAWHWVDKQDKEMKED